MSTVLERSAKRIARWLVSRPIQALWLLIGVSLASAAALPFLRIEAGQSAFLADDDPATRFSEEVEKAFVNDDVVIVAYETDDPFSQRSLEEIRAFGKQVAAFSRPKDGSDVSVIDDVTSLATVKDVRGADMTFRSVPLVPDEVPSSPAELEEIRAHAKANRLIREGLLSASSPRLAALLVRLTPGSTDVDRAFVVERLRALIAAQPSQTRFYVTGLPVASVDAVHYMQLDLQRFIPITYTLLMVLMLLFTRRLIGVLLAIINATVAIVVGMAILAALGSLTTLSTIMPPMLMVLSVATVVHFLTEYARNTHVVGPARAAEVSLSELMVPAFMCELTTAVGFLSFAISRIPAMREFGLAAALAVMASLFTSFLVLAVAVRYFGAERLISSQGIAASARVERVVGRYTDLAIAWPKAMLAFVGALSLLAATGLWWFRVDHSDLGQFDRGLPIRQATDLVNAQLGGSNELIVSIKTPNEGRFLEPAELAKLEALEHFLQTDVQASNATSVADHVKLMHRGFNDDAPEAERVPETREQVAQLVLLNGDDRVFHYVDRTWKWARVGARTAESGSDRLMRRFGQIDAYLAQHFPRSAGYEAAVTGSTHKGVVMANNILDGQVSSFLLSFILIFIPITLVFGSAIAGLYTIPSNIFPILACLGLMGWFDIPLDIPTSMVASIILGIAVDDTIHFIQSLRAGIAEHDDVQRALRHTMATKGVGALWIALIITSGFVALLASNFKPTHDFGLLTAFAMVAGIVAEIFLLPPLIIVTGTRLGVPLRARLAPTEAEATPVVAE